MSNTNNTNAADLTDITAAIEATEVTDADLVAARKFLGSFAYTATALTALHMAMRELERDLGDTNTDASALLLETADRMVAIDAAVA